MISELQHARKLLATHGWVGPRMEPFCRGRGGATKLNPDWKPGGAHPVELEVSSDSILCSHEYEGLTHYSVDGVLRAARCFPEGWELLESVVAPASVALREFMLTVKVDEMTKQQARNIVQLCRASIEELPLQSWLEVPERQLADVLRIFNTAILRLGRDAH